MPYIQISESLNAIIHAHRLPSGERSNNSGHLLCPLLSEYRKHDQIWIYVVPFHWWHNQLFNRCLSWRCEVVSGRSSTSVPLMYRVLRLQCFITRASFIHKGCFTHSWNGQLYDENTTNNEHNIWMLFVLADIGILWHCQRTYPHQGRRMGISSSFRQTLLHSKRPVLIQFWWHIYGDMNTKFDEGNTLLRRSSQSYTTKTDDVKKMLPLSNMHRPLNKNAYNSFDGKLQWTNCLRSLV